MSDADRLADELSRRWYELGSMLRSRRLLASLHAGATAKLTPTSLRALDVLGRAGGLRVGELAERVGVDETTATRLADRLERAGFASRRSVASDRRATEVVLTGTGERMARAAARERLRFFVDVLSALDPHEREELVRLTAKASEALDATSRELIAR
jgi:DNA-binding MarR family transcriptional regulator